MLDDVAARVALAVAGRDERAAHVAGARSGRRACGRRRVSATRSGTCGNTSGSWESTARARRRGRRASARGDVRAAVAQVGQAGDVEAPARRVDGERVVLEHGDPGGGERASTSASPNCFQSWLPSTATAPSGARRPREPLGDPLGREPAAEQRVRVGEVAAEQDDVRRLVVHALDPAADAASPAWRTPACRSVITPTRSPASASGQRGSASASLADDEPARLDPAGVGGEPRRGEREAARAARRARRAQRRPRRGAACPRARRRARVESAAAATRERGGLAQRAARRQLGGERAVEGVAGAGRVDGVHARRGQPARRRRRRAAARRRAPSVTSTGAPVRAASARAAASGSRSPVSSRGLGRVGREHRRARHARRQRPRGRGVEHDRAAGRGARAAPSTAASGTSWLEQHDARRGRAHRALDRGGAELGVGAGGDRDLVLARRVDDDQRDAGRRVQPRDAANVDPLALERAPGLRAEVVVADRADHRHRARPAAPPRRPGWRPCRRRGGRSARPRPSRPGAGSRSTDDDEVGVDRSDDDEPVPARVRSSAAHYADAPPAGTGGAPAGAASNCGAE